MAQARKRMEQKLVLRVTLRDYLTRLEAAETVKLPSQRHKIPTIAELAHAAGVTRQALYNIAEGRVKMVNLETLGSVLSELRQRGFDTEVSDLLTAYRVEELPSDHES